MKYIIIPFTLFFIFIFHSQYAQSDFREGYIINNENDTTYGLIDYRGSMRSSKHCTFKSDDASEQIKYSPSEIAGYRFTDNKYYVSRTVKREEGASVFFLEFLINGKVDIYFYRDKGEDYYLVDNGMGIYII